MGKWGLEGRGVKISLVFLLRRPLRPPPLPTPAHPEKLPELLGRPEPQRVAAFSSVLSEEQFFLLLGCAFF